MWSWSTNVTDRCTDRQTDRRTDDMRSQDCALHYSESRGKNERRSWGFASHSTQNTSLMSETFLPANLLVWYRKQLSAAHRLIRTTRCLTPKRPYTLSWTLSAIISWRSSILLTALEHVHRRQVLSTTVACLSNTATVRAVAKLVPDTVPQGSTVIFCKCTNFQKNAV